MTPQLYINYEEAKVDLESRSFGASELGCRGMAKVPCFFLFSDTIIHSEVTQLTAYLLDELLSSSIIFECVTGTVFSTGNSCGQDRLGSPVGRASALGSHHSHTATMENDLKEARLMWTHSLREFSPRSQGPELEHHGGGKEGVRRKQNQV